MKDIYKKILISLSAFILVLSFSFTHLNSSKRFEVQASEFSITHQVATVIAVLLAAAGIQLVNEPSLDQMQSIYNGLSIEAQGVLSSPTLGNNIVNDMIALPYSQAQDVIHSLINTFDAWNLTGTNYFDDNLDISNGSILLTKLSQTGNLINWQIGNTTFLTETNTTLFTGSLAGHFVMNCIISSMTPVFAPFNTFGNAAIGSTDTTVQLGLKISSNSICEYGIGSTGAVLPNFSNPNGYIVLPKYFENPVFRNRNIFYDPAYLTTEGLLSLQLSAGGLTLPAPTNGWDNSQSGDVNLEGWTKGLNIPDVGDVVVLGGLAAGTLAGLSPEAVLVPSGSQTPFDPSEEPDPGDEDPYNPPPAENASWFAAWTAAALGAGSALFGYDPVRDAFAAIQNAIQAIVQPLINGLTASFQTMLQALMQPFISAFSVMIQGLFALDIPATQLKIEGIRSAIFARIPCVEETLNAWYQIMAVNGSNLISSFTFFGETFSISSGTLLQAFQGFGNMIKQAFRFVFWFIFLKGMRRRVTSFLGLVSAER